MSSGIVKRVLITGIAGLVGQNLVTRLKGREDIEIIGIDKHPENCSKFREIHPDVTLIEADLAIPGVWEKAFENIDILIINHAQIGGLTIDDFNRNNLTATEHILEAAILNKLGYIIHISSSVVHSSADDFYTQTKTAQEQMVLNAAIPSVVLRPTLMYGWFDRKHMGWLAGFMKKSPVFPIPGKGDYIRQPLYVGDFCNVIISCMNNNHAGEVYDISGLEQIHYVDLIKELKKQSSGKAIIVKIPYMLFWWLLKIYSWFDKEPPFTTNQLEALVIPEVFPIIDWPSKFEISSTSLADALNETYNHPVYSKVKLEF